LTAILAVSSATASAQVCASLNLTSQAQVDVVNCGSVTGNVSISGMSYHLGAGVQSARSEESSASKEFVQAYSWRGMGLNGSIQKEVDGFCAGQESEPVDQCRRRLSGLLVATEIMKNRIRLEAVEAKLGIKAPE
jgi:hypothetical protein